MADFIADTALEGEGGRYRVRLSADWEIWGPLGGYVAAIALRAMGCASDLPRPASISVQFLSVAAFDEAEVEVTSLRRGKRAEALHVRMHQKGKPVLAATGWTVADGMNGLAHDHAAMPAVPPPAELPRYAELAPNYDEWYPAWHGAIDGKPLHWSENGEPGSPSYLAWMRLTQNPRLEDPFLDAARSLCWLDMMMWNAALVPHLPWPISHIAPNLDVTAIFHDSAGEDEWLLCDSDAPVARHGIIGCGGRVWSPSGRLVASGNACLFCRPNPYVAD